MSCPAGRYRPTTRRLRTAFPPRPSEIDGHHPVCSPVDEDPALRLEPFELLPSVRAQLLDEVSLQRWHAGVQELREPEDERFLPSGDTEIHALTLRPCRPGSAGTPWSNTNA